MNGTLDRDYAVAGLLGSPPVSESGLTPHVLDGLKESLSDIAPSYRPRPVRKGSSCDESFPSARHVGAPRPKQRR